MSTLTKEQKEAYLKSPNHCPFCKSENISAESLEIESSTAWCPVSCNDCDEEWRDVYTLTDIETNEL